MTDQQRDARIAELRQRRQEIDAELAALTGASPDSAASTERRMLERLMETAPIGIAVVRGPAHRYTYVNPAYQMIPGTANTPMVGRTLGEVFPDLIAKGVPSSLDEIYVTGQPVAFRAFEANVGPGREQTYWDVDQVPVMDADGQVDSILILTREVTEHIRNTQALQRLGWLATYSRDIILFMARDGRLLDANAAALAAYGYSRDELLSLSIHDLRADETLALTSAQMAEADAAGILFETLHRRKDGSTFPVEVSSRGVTIDDTRTLVSVIRDISDRQRAEEAQRQLAQFPAENPNPVLRLGIDGEIRYANGPGRAMLEALADAPLSPAILATVAAAVASSGSVETELVDRNGRIYGITATHPAGERYVNLYARDITERKQAEAALRESEHRLDAVFHGVTETIMLLDIAGNVLMANETAAQRWGLPVDALIGRNCFTLLPPHVRETRMAHMHQIRATGQPLTFQEERDGTVYDLTCYPLKNAQGDVDQSIVFSSDITERTRAVEALRKSRDQFTALIQNVDSGAALVD